jgi:hypothetical protein
MNVIVLDASQCGQGSIFSHSFRVLVSGVQGARPLHQGTELILQPHDSGNFDPGIEPRGK